ncbi:hypothetical protein Tco_0632361, partial [Tanacetum coccineum]
RFLAVLSNISGRSSVMEQPLERLLKVVKIISPTALCTSVSDIGSVVSMINRIVRSTPELDSTASSAIKRPQVEGFAAALAVLITRASQSRQHATHVRLSMDIRLKIDLGKSLGDLTSHLPHSLFDVGSGRISIVTVNTFKYHSDVLAKSQG